MCNEAFTREHKITVKNKNRRKKLLRRHINRPKKSQIHTYPYSYHRRAFSHPDCEGIRLLHCRLRNHTGSCRSHKQLAGCTAGGDFHPASKSIITNAIVSFCIWTVNCKSCTRRVSPRRGARPHRDRRRRLRQSQRPHCPQRRGSPPCARCCCAAPR